MFYSEFHPKGEIELVPQPELTLSGSVHCLEAPLCQLDTRVKSPSNHRLRGRVRSLSSPTETPRPVLGPSSLRTELQGRRENLTRARDGPPSLGWPRRCERMELSTHRHFLDFAILKVLASESCSPPALNFIRAQERCTLPGHAILSKVRPSFSWRFRVFQSSTTGGD